MAPTSGAAAPSQLTGDLVSPQPGDGDGEASQAGLGVDALSGHHPVDGPGVDADGLAGLPTLQNADWLLGQSRWIGWRLRLLVTTTLAGCLGLLFFIMTVAMVPVPSATLSINGTNDLVVSTGSTMGVVQSVDDVRGNRFALDTIVVERPARWIVSDEERAQHEMQRDQLARAKAAGPIAWTLTDGRRVVSDLATPLGYQRLGAPFWLLTILALALFLVVAIVVLAKPRWPNILFAVIGLPQVGHLLLVASESALGPWGPSGLAHLNHSWGSALDVVSAAGMSQVAALHPRPLPWRHALAWGVWPLTALLVAALLAVHLPWSWWLVQLSLLALAGVALGQFLLAYRLRPHPLSLLQLRFGLVATVIYALLTLSLWAADLQSTGATRWVGTLGTTIWIVFVAMWMLATPFLGRTQPLIREFAMLAGVSTMATALDLLFLAFFALSSLASFSLALFLSVMVYAGLRQWMLNQMLRTNVLTTERTFAQIYRMARDVEGHPQHLSRQLVGLLHELYDPIDAQRIERNFEHAHVVGGGSAMVVPVPSLKGQASTQAIVLRYAHRGKRLFTQDDALLTDRVLDQLVRALAFDQAVDRGRREERERIAQDLHDDIGARLLTLMYQAKDVESEDYIRHTIQELKTLTRGLAAREHRLSDAMAEWKADKAHRLTAAHCELDWQLKQDRDVMLSVVQWSALTRILRELVTNTIAHGHATKVRVAGGLQGDRFVLEVVDNGDGHGPQHWGHGLGLGGIRKRVKQLDGTVAWTEAEPRGIRCSIEFPMDNRAIEAGESL